MEKAEFDEFLGNAEESSILWLKVGKKGRKRWMNGVDFQTSECETVDFRQV